MRLRKEKAKLAKAQAELAEQQIEQNNADLPWYMQKTVGAAVRNALRKR